MPPMRRIALALALPLALGTACKRSPPPPPSTYSAPVATGPAAPSTAPAGHFDGDKLVLDGHPEWSCKLSYGFEGDLSCSAVGVVDWPAGTKLAYGKDEAPIANYATAKLSAPYAIYGSLPIAARPLDELVAPFDATDPTIHPQGKLAVRFSNGVESTVELPEGKIPKSLANKIMVWASTHPLTFEGETEHKGPHTIYWLQTELSSNVIGPGKHLAEADWIATTTRTDASTSTNCSYQGGKVYPLEIETRAVKIVDRKTGAEIESKSFTPSNASCPMFAVYERAVVAPDLKTVGTWLESVVKSRH